jgi:hypothetical protein
MKYRVVNTDNYGGDYPNEKFVTEPIEKKEAEKIADALNEQSGPYSSRFWKTVPEDYKLQPGFEP